VAGFWRKFQASARLDLEIRLEKTSHA